MTISNVYVALLDEGVTVWRPVPAHALDDGTFVLLRPEGYDPDDETWEFPPGSVVRCATRHAREGDVLTATDRIAILDRQSA